MFKILSRNDKYIEAIIYDGIDMETQGGLVDALALGADEIDLTIASNGGDIDVGFAIYDLLDAWKDNHTLRIHASGSVASAAILPFCLRVHRDARPDAFFTIHSVQAGDWGTAATHAKTAAILDAYDARLVEIYKRVSTLPEAELLDYIRAETIFSAEVALEWGFLSELRMPADDISSAPVDYFRINGGIMSVKKNELSPEEIEQVKEVIVEEEKVEEVKEEAQERVDEDAAASDDDRISRIESAIEKMAQSLAMLMERFERADGPLDFMAAPKLNKKPSVYDKSGLTFKN